MTPKMVIVDVLLRRFGGKMITINNNNRKVGTYLMFAFGEVQYAVARSQLMKMQAKICKLPKNAFLLYSRSGTSGTKYCGGTVLAILGWRAGVDGGSVASTGPLYTGHPAHNAQFGLRPHTAHISLQHPASLHHPYTGTQVRQNKQSYLIPDGHRYVEKAHPRALTTYCMKSH